MKAHCYNYDTDTEVSFESDKPHCASCIEDEFEGYRSWMDLGCCCIHQSEGKDLGLTGESLT